MRYLTSIVALVLTLAGAGCGKKPLVLVAQSGQTLSGSIVEAQKATKALTDGQVLTPRQARPVQETLGEAADAMVPLPDLLIAIDEATRAGQTDAARIEAALKILATVGVKLDDVILNLPVGTTATDVLTAVSEARKLREQVIQLLARRKSAALLLAPAAAIA